jgi:membrane protease YdiL (CAAX protease family)
MSQTEFKFIGWVRVLAFIVPYFIVVSLFQLAGMAISGVDYEKINVPKTFDQQLIVSGFGLLGTFLIIFIFVKFVERIKFVSLGFQTKNRLTDFVIGIVLGLLIMVLGYVILIFFNEIEFKNMIFKPLLILKSIVLFFIVSLTEEALFRGFVLRNLTISFNKYVALILSSVLFSLMHSFNPNIDLLGYTNLFLAGLFLGIAYIHTKNLWFPIALHFSWNLFQTFFGFNVSGLDMYSIVEFSVNKKNSLNGGDFGFEGSILSIIVMIIIVVFIEVYYQRKNK